LEIAMTLLRSIVVTLALGLMAGKAGAVSLIVNGGFEVGNFTPVGGGITTYDTITQAGPQDLTGWTVGNSLVWGLNTTDINTHTGNGYVDFTGVGDTTPHGILYQTIATNIGTTYDFSAFLTQDFRGSVGIDVLANGVLLALVGTPGFWNYDPAGAGYGEMTASFIASSSSTLISIVGKPLGSRQFMIGIDDVRVNGPVLSVVPIPGALPLLASALGALGLMRRKRKTLRVTHRPSC
jgi:hypothetical protein